MLGDDVRGVVVEATPTWGSQGCARESDKMRQFLLNVYLNIYVFFFLQPPKLDLKSTITSFIW